MHLISSAEKYMRVMCILYEDLLFQTSDLQMSFRAISCIRWLSRRFVDTALFSCFYIPTITRGLLDNLHSNVHARYHYVCGRKLNLKTSRNLQHYVQLIIMSEEENMKASKKKLQGIIMF